jgi:hypothetical protein
MSATAAASLPPPPPGHELRAEEMTASHPLPAWLCSLVLHATVLVTLAFLVRFTPRGASPEPARPGGIVLVSESQGKREYFDGGAAARAAKSAAATSHNVAGALPGPGELSPDALAALPSPGGSSGLADSLASGLPGAGQFTQGSGRSATGISGERTRTSVFGIMGEGSKFLYVFDRSGSMEGYGGRPLAAAKAELIASLKQLDRIHQFQIIFYNEQPRAFSPRGGEPRMVYGDPGTKDLAERFVRGILADGGTRHLEALQSALRLGPDVVFFLTDADEPQLTPGDLQKIRQMNRGAAIHAIEFGYGPPRGGDNFLVRLARENGGQHAYVDISKLPH